MGLATLVRCAGYPLRRMIEGRLTTILHRTKTSGPNGQVKEQPFCVSEKAYFAKSGRLETGFDLLQLMFATSGITLCFG